MTASNEKQEVRPTPNPQNLRAPTPTEARERGRKGGQASAAKRAERKTLKEGLLLLLNEQLKDKDGKATEKTTQDAIIAGLVKRAVSGDTRAFEIIRDTIGEKPTETVKVTGDYAALNDSFSALDGDAQ